MNLTLVPAEHVRPFTVFYVETTSAEPRYGEVYKTFDGDFLVKLYSSYSKLKAEGQYAIREFAFHEAKRLTTLSQVTQRLKS